MGDMADMMLDGTMCSCCGVYIGTNNDYPTMCPSCEKDSPKDNKVEKINCQYCGKMIHPEGIDQHLKAKHSK